MDEFPSIKTKFSIKGVIKQKAQKWWMEALNALNLTVCLNV